MAESNRIDKRLERRTHLPVRRSQRPIEFALRVITAAHERADPATCIIDNNDRALEVRHGRVPFPVFRRLVFGLGRMPKIGLALDFAQLRLERVLRGILHGWIERRVNGKPTVIHLVLVRIRLNARCTASIA